MLAGGAVHRAVLPLLGRVGHACRPHRQGGHRALGQDRRDRHHGARRAGASGAAACRCCSRRSSASARTRPSSGRSSTRCCRSTCASDELVAGNALIEAGTFLAILLGTILGGSIVLARQRRARRRRASASSAARARLAGRAAHSAGAAVAGGRPAAAPPASRHGRGRAATSRSRPQLLLPILAISWFWLFGATVVSGLPVFAKDVLFANEQVVTLMLALFAVGVGAGSIARRAAAARRGQRAATSHRRRRDGALRDRSASAPARARRRRRSSPASRRSCAARKLAHPRRPRRPRDGRRPLHRAALRPAAARERAGHRARVIAANNIINAVAMTAGALGAGALCPRR